MDLKMELQKLNKKNVIDPIIYNNKNEDMFSNNIELKTIINLKSYTRNPKENTFFLFNSIDNILNLVYGTKELSIICFNINDNKKEIEIKKAHDDDIIGFNHFLDKKNKRDLLMSISALNFLKIWNANNWECLLHLEKVNNTGLLSSVCFLNNDGEGLIVTSNSTYIHAEKIKVFNLKGEKIKEIYNSNEDSLYINTYYDEEQSRIYIIVCSKDYIKSYDYDNNNLYHKYFEKNSGHHFSFLIYKEKEKEITKLIESCSTDGLIRIWNFHFGNILYRIRTNLKPCSLCLWNNKYLFCGSLDGKILIIDIINQIVFNNFEGHKNWVNCIRKFKNNKYGECLITQGFDDTIKIWSNNI